MSGRWLAAPAAAAYGAAVLGRRWLYDRGLLPIAAAPVRVISVGGLEAGGSGKTPIAELIVRRLLAAGRSPGIATRGYGRRSRGLVVRPVGGPASPNDLGDEPAMWIAGGLDVPVAACAERAGAVAALAGLGCDVVVLDDGFAHRALARDLDIVVLRGEASGGHLLPWGTLREPPSSLRRAQVVWYHYRTAAPPPAPPAWHSRWAPEVPVVVSRAVPFVVRGGSLTGLRVLAVAGIARPEDFAANLRALGAEVVDLQALRDHHPYDARDAERFEARRRELGADAWVVTPKDAVKLDTVAPGHAASVVGVRVDVVDEAGLAQVLAPRTSQATPAGRSR